MSFPSSAIAKRVPGASERKCSPFYAKVRSWIPLRKHVLRRINNLAGSETATRVTNPRSAEPLLEEW